MSTMHERTAGCISRMVRISAFALALVALLWLALTRALPARAGGVVATCDEPSLQAALAGGGQVTFNCAGSPVITLSSEIVITADASIDGANNGSSVTVSGNNMTSIFSIAASHMLTIANITLRDGNGPSVGCIWVGPNSSLFALQTTLMSCHGDLKGALWIAHNASATLVDSRVLSNSSNEHSGGISVEISGTLTLSNSLLAYNHNDYCPVVCSGNPWERAGGIVNSGTMTLSNVMVTGNVVGGVANLGKATFANVTFTGNTGSAISNFGTAVLNDVTVSDTVGTYPGLDNFFGTAVLNNSMISNNPSGGIYNNLGTLTLTNVTINDNLHWGCMRGLICGGGGIEMWGGTATLINVTLSGNFAAGYGGAIFMGGGTATLLNVTIFDNAATFGSIYISHQPYWSYSSTVLLTNTIVANNPSGVNCSERLGGSFNLSSDGSCGFGVHRDYQYVMLNPLAYKGGLTPTHLPLPDSPAIDFGSNSNCPPIDQRGVVRPQGAGCDVGAVERQATDVDILPEIWLPLVRR